MSITHHYQHDSVTSATSSCQLSSVRILKMPWHHCYGLVCCLMHLVPPTLHTPFPRLVVGGASSQATYWSKPGTVAPNCCSWCANSSSVALEGAEGFIRFNLFLTPAGLVHVQHSCLSLCLSYMVDIYWWWKPPHLWTLVSVPSCPSPCHKSRVACGASHHLRNKRVTCNMWLAVLIEGCTGLMYKLTLSLYHYSLIAFSRLMPWHLASFCNSKSVHKYTHITYIYIHSSIQSPNPPWFHDTPHGRIFYLTSIQGTCTALSTARSNSSSTFGLALRNTTVA